MKRPNGTGGIRKLKGKRRKPYQAVISVHDNGTRRQVSLGCYRTKKEAMEALAKQNYLKLDASARNTTFREISEIVIPKQKESVQTAIKNVLPRLSPIMDYRMIDIKSPELTLVTDRCYDVSPATQNAVKTLVKRVFDYALMMDIVAKDYSVYMSFPPARPRKRAIPLSDSEILVLKAHPLWQIMLYSGMRVSEAMEMDDEDIYEEDEVLCFHVRESKTKAGIRTIPVHSALLDLVQPYPIKGLTMNKVQFLFKKLQLPHTTHTLRHTFISRLKDAGADPYYIEELVGHKHKTLTENVYTHPSIKRLKETIEMFEEVKGK